MEAHAPDAARGRRDKADEFRSRRGIRGHCSPLLPDEFTHERGIPVTTVPRTVLDLAAVSSRRQTERVLNEIEVRGFTDRLSIPQLLTRHSGRQGTARLRAILASNKAPSGVTRSELEERFVGLLALAGMPRPRLNAHLSVGGRFFSVDCLWQERRLIVELDGRAVHGTGWAFERDRERDRMLQAAGWRVVRVTWRQLRDDAPAVVADLCKTLQLAAPPTL